MKNLPAFLMGLLAWVTADAAVKPEDLFAPAKFGLVTIAPSGKHIAVTRRIGEQALFQVYTNPGNERVFNYDVGTKKEIRFMQWVNDRAMVFGYARRFMNIGDAKGWTTELLSFDVKKLKLERLPDGFLLHTLPDDPDHILIEGSATRFNQAHKVNVYNGTFKRVARAAGANGSFVSDHEGNVVFSTSTTSEDVDEVYIRKGRDKWRLIESHAGDEEGWRPLTAGPREGTFYTRDWRGGGTAGLGLYDVNRDEHRMLIQFDNVDLGGFYRDHAYNLYGAYTDMHYPSAHIVDAQHPLARILKELQRANPQDYVTITSNSKDNTKAIALVQGDRNPGHFLLVDLNAEQKVKLLFRRNPGLTRDTLAEMHPVELKARDGRTIYGYMTSAASTPKPGPMVVLVHGGPYGVRDYWGFNGQVQMLASLGVHVLQVNFRGSGGYGIEYQKAGFGEWGASMQDDVTDATRWAIDTKVADPDQVCIMGGSYGAYAALMGAAKEPDLYACAIGMFGIYDLTILDSIGDIKDNDWGRAYLESILMKSDEELRAVSPNHLADQIKAKVMLAHGGKDRRAPPKHATLMRAALRAAGNEPVWYFKDAQFHGFIGQKAQTELFQNISGFLSDALGIQTPEVAKAE